MGGGGAGIPPQRESPGGGGAGIPRVPQATPTRSQATPPPLRSSRAYFWPRPFSPSRSFPPPFSATPPSRSYWLPSAPPLPPAPLIGCAAPFVPRDRGSFREPWPCRGRRARCGPRPGPGRARGRPRGRSGSSSRRAGPPRDRRWGRCWGRCGEPGGVLGCPGAPAARPDLSSPVLPQRGVPIAAFCKDFNERTRDIKPGVPLRVRLLVHPDRTYSLSIGTPPTSYFLKAVAGVEKGSARPGHEPAGLVSLAQLFEVAVAKQRDPAVAARGTSLPALLGSVLGSARSLGLLVVPRLTAQAVADVQRRRRELQAAAAAPDGQEEDEGGARRK
uniref:Large ribosomal subunit protein uL11m n=1 Tax=Taeniopygia guttata TaxID=59729 RepID=A0A674GSE9_TAEGU